MAENISGGMPNGLLLGAGASYEMGKPLVDEFTTEIKEYLGRFDLRTTNRDWQEQGHGFPEELIDELLSFLEQPKANYENLLGYFQLMYNRHGGHGVGQDYAGLFSWLSELVYILLYSRHMKFSRFISSGLSTLDGLKELADAVHPLWVFSLNQDLIIEMLAKEWGIPIRSGFSTTVDHLEMYDQKGHKLGEIPYHLTLSSELQSKPLQFFTKKDENGINLFKIHGSLDIFLADDKKRVIKLADIGKGSKSGLLQLRKLNEDYAHQEPPRVINHILYYDKNGEIQFLQRALISGVQKYKKHLLLGLPKEYLKLFRSHLNYASHIAIIGYSFGDIHINEMLQDWLEFSRDRQVTIVDPFIKAIPIFFGHMQNQIEIRTETTTEYFNNFSDKKSRFTRELYRQTRLEFRKKL